MNEALIADPVRSKQILERIPAGRWGTAEDFEGAIVFLASRASDYVSGECLVVDGGWMGSESLNRTLVQTLTSSRIDLCLSPLVYVFILGFLCIPYKAAISHALEGIARVVVFLKIKVTSYQFIVSSNHPLIDTVLYLSYS